MFLHLMKMVKNDYFERREIVTLCIFGLKDIDFTHLGLKVFEAEDNQVTPMVGIPD